MDDKKASGDVALHGCKINDSAGGWKLVRATPRAHSSKLSSLGGVLWILLYPLESWCHLVPFAYVRINARRLVCKCCSPMWHPINSQHAEAGNCGKKAFFLSVRGWKVESHCCCLEWSVRAPWCGGGREYKETDLSFPSTLATLALLLKICNNSTAVKCLLVLKYGGWTEILLLFRFLGTGIGWNGPECGCPIEFSDRHKYCGAYLWQVHSSLFFIFSLNKYSFPLTRCKIPPKPNKLYGAVVFLWCKINGLKCALWFVEFVVFSGSVEIRLGNRSSDLPGSLLHAGHTWVIGVQSFCCKLCSER